MGAALAADVRVEELRDGACRSFVVTDGTSALIVDPILAPDAYRAAVGQRARILAVAETHLHSDHASTARAVADAFWCALVLPENRRALFAHARVRDADALPLGLVARAAPGHTAESLCYHGDGFILIGDALEPPDVDATAQDARLRAATQHGTVQRLLTLPDDTRLLPAHAPGTTVAELRASTLHLEDRDAFVEAILARRVVDLERVRTLARNLAGIGRVDGPLSLSKRP